jgi:hypothetical protein
MTEPRIRVPGQARQGEVIEIKRLSGNMTWQKSRCVG